MIALQQKNLILRMGHGAYSITDPFIKQVWLRSPIARTIPGMPFPIDKIDRLGNYDGTWSLGVRCRRCAHARLIPAPFLIRLFGRETRLATVVPRLYCSPCSGRGCRCAGKDFEAQVWIPR